MTVDARLRFVGAEAGPAAAAALEADYARFLASTMRRQRDVCLTCFALLYTIAIVAAAAIGTLESVDLAYLIVVVLSVALLAASRVPDGHLRRCAARTRRYSGNPTSLSAALALPARALERHHVRTSSRKPTVQVIPPAWRARVRHE